MITPLAVANPSNPASLLTACVTYLAAGDAAAALQAASDACHLAPDLPQAHYAYGQAWLALNEPVRAEEAFARTLQLDPTQAEAWINYGVARYRQGQIEDAKTAMRQALRHVPQHEAAAANLGAFMRISGQSDDAETLLRALMARSPRNIGARLNLAADLLQEERADEALALLEASFAPVSDLHALRQWHLQRSLALLQLGQDEAAEVVLEALLALGKLPADIAPLFHWRQMLLALARRDPQRACQQADLMETHLGQMGPDAIAEHRIMGHFDLAKFWSGQNQHARAFPHWVQGHELLKPGQPFSREADKAVTDANIQAFSAARLRCAPKSRNTDSAPVFIVGMPRSGTTLCEQILAAHRDVHGAGERNALGRAFAALGGDAGHPDAAGRIAGLAQSALDDAAASYLAELHALAPDKARIVDKMPGNYRHLGLVGLMLPGARIIHCVRDPRDIGLSIFTFRFHGLHPYAHDLGDLGWAIAEQSRVMAHWKAALPNPVLTVRLSDWVDNLYGTIARVLAHLELPPDAQCARFHEGESRVRTVSRAQVRQPVNARGLGRWRAYASELAPLIAALHEAGAVLPSPADPPDPG